MSALRYVKITTKNNKFVVFGYSKSALQALLSKWDHPTVQTIMRFLVFLHTVHKTVIFCWLPSHMGISGNERADSAAKTALQKDVSDCLISYTDTRRASTIARGGPGKILCELHLIRIYIKYHVFFKYITRL